MVDRRPVLWLCYEIDHILYRCWLFCYRCLRIFIWYSISNLMYLSYYNNKDFCITWLGIFKCCIWLTTSWSVRLLGRGRTGITLYLEYQSTRLSLRPNWFPPPPLPRANVSPLEPEGGATLACGWGDSVFSVGQAQYTVVGEWQKSKREEDTLHATSSEGEVTQTRKTPVLRLRGGWAERAHWWNMQDWHAANTRFWKSDILWSSNCNIIF
jgi:hypothetical protein